MVFEAGTRELWTGICAAKRSSAILTSLLLLLTARVCDVTNFAKGICPADALRECMFLPCFAVVMHAFKSCTCARRSTLEVVQQAILPD